MRIGERKIGPGSSPYIIAEIGVNHDGDVERAASLIQAATDAGADAVKFQYFEADRLFSPHARLAVYQKDQGEDDPHAMLRRLELSLDDLAGLIDIAHAANRHAIVTVFSVEHIASVAELPWDAFKTASPDVINHPLLSELLATGRPVIVSTGAADPDEITAAATIGGEAFLHCVSAYPTPESAAQLAGIRALRALLQRCERGDAVVGYSDHTASTWTGGLAVAAGANILEKHLTWDTQAKGPDHAASLNPMDFAAFVQFARRAFYMLGTEEVLVQGIESDVRNVSRQSLVCVHDLDVNHILTRDDLTVRRPGTGLSPAVLPRVIGKRLARAVSANQPLTDDDIDGAPSP